MEVSPSFLEWELSPVLPWPLAVRKSWPELEPRWGWQDEFENPKKNSLQQGLNSSGTVLQLGHACFVEVLKCQKCGSWVLGEKKSPLTHQPVSVAV